MWKKMLLITLLNSLFIESAFTRELLTIQDSGYIRIGTTGDYPPLTDRGRNDNYKGFAIDMAHSLGRYLSQKSSRKIEVQFVQTYWSGLHKELEKDHFDIAMGGITRTPARAEQFLLSSNVTASGKVALIRKEHYLKVKGLNDQELITTLNNPGFRLVENPGGTNILFARKHLPNTQLMVTADNKEPFLMLRENKADLMITDLIEARYTIQNESELTIANEATFTETRSHKVYMMQKSNQSLLKAVNEWLSKEDIRSIQNRWF